MHREAHDDAPDLRHDVVPERVHEYRNHHLDSTRWDGFRPRDDDIVVTTAYKAGTTWTQGILAALILGPGPVDLFDASPWIDARFMGPLEPVLDRLEAQQHRRFVKSHLAADGIRWLPQAKYLVVGRDTRDVFMSLWNHYTGYTDIAYSLFNDAERPGREFPRPPASPRDLWPQWIAEGWFEWEPDGWPFWSHHHHLSTWWRSRDLDNVLLVHYGDLKSDTRGEIQRIATFLGIDVPEDAWPPLLESVGIDTMRERARGDGDRASLIFEGGAGRFFYQGSNGRWRDVLTDDDLACTTPRRRRSSHPCGRGWRAGAMRSAWTES
ncbi:MAG TPA: sulfotransferase domain-containing protein [Acidimicrobiia bacterium]|nr:sulfotransferase domain-containing protein [Acidimicrobiia bacterium]